jgi:hypothetical protein
MTNRRVPIGMTHSAFSAVATHSTDRRQANACRHCGSLVAHWFTPPEASDEGAVLLCARCGRLTTILVARGGIVRAWPSTSRNKTA